MLARIVCNNSRIDLQNAHETEFVPLEEIRIREESVINREVYLSVGNLNIYHSDMPSLIEKIKDAHEGVWIRDDGETMVLWCDCFGRFDEMISDRYERFFDGHRIYKIEAASPCGSGRLGEYVKEEIERLMEAEDEECLKVIKEAKEALVETHGEDYIEDLLGYEILYEIDATFLKEVEGIQLGLMAEHCIDQIDEFIEEILE